MDDVLNEQAAYYRARAAEYDEWFYRKGRYDRGEDINRQWFDEVAILLNEVHNLKPARILELACGTGIWTAELAQRPEAQITAVDASPEMLFINRARVDRKDIEYIQADLFQWEPKADYDLVFFSFWLSHVPPDGLAAFLDKVVRRATRPGGELFIIDSLPSSTSSARDHAAYQPDDIYHTRKLNDGREFRVIKVFYEAEPLAAALSAAGFEAEIRTTGNYFWYTHGYKRLDEN
jgi:demethylmenaquinone methyltransferase/2-methoxy-6-polyprenyl-1,4-benzoquinol methylase